MKKSYEAPALERVGDLKTLTRQIAPGQSPIYETPT